MGKPKNMKNMLRILKDKVSIIKATLSFSSKPTTSFHVAILRATPLNHPLDPPPVDAVLALTQNHRPSAGVLLHALLQRLHGTHSAYVALKCLLTLHYVITYGSPGVQEQVKGYSCGPLFNLSNFRDDSDRDTWELSDWVRWYADVLDHSILLQKTRQQQPSMSQHQSKLTSLVVMIEKISRAPETLHYQKLSLIYEVMKLVGEDYRLIMREINAKINIIEMKNIQDYNDKVLENLLSDLKRVEDCKEKMLLMFLNKKKNDGVWELIEEIRKKVENVKEKREGMNELMTRGLDERVDESKSLTVVPGPRVKRWLDVDWNPLVVSSD